MLWPARDEVTPEVPPAPTHREGASIWVWDDTGRRCFPRIGVEAVGATWTTSFATAVCMAWPDGRLLLALGDDAPHPVNDSRGAPRVLGAGPLRFECLEPFEHWRITFDGTALSTDVRSYLAEGLPKPRLSEGAPTRSLRFELDARSLCPPWFQGSHQPEGRFVAGEDRFEQLCEVTGTVVLDGARSSFGGGGLRVHRKGGNRSDYGDFHGHNWQSAHFPSGRAFGFIHYRSPDDSSIRYREGWVRIDGEILPARVEGTPWLSTLEPNGGDVSFTLHTARGAIRIGGTTFASSLRPPRRTAEGTTFPLLHSGIARYRWGEEEAYGMIERSARIDVDVSGTPG